MGTANSMDTRHKMRNGLRGVAGFFGEPPLDDMVGTNPKAPSGYEARVGGATVTAQRCTGLRTRHCSIAEDHKVRATNCLPQCVDY